MPNWKKLIVSGSDANLNSLNVTTSITGSDVKIDDWGSISGSLANLTDNTPDGSGTANYITKWSDSDTLSNSTIYDNAGIITIGSTQQGWSGNKLNIGSTSDGAAGMNILTSATGNAYIIFSDVVDGSASEYANQIRYSHTDNFLAIQTEGTERLRIKSGGNVGIGTSNPAKKLSVVGDVSITGGGNTYLDVNHGNVGFIKFTDTSITTPNTFLIQHNYAQDNDFRIARNTGGQDFVINTDGNVGIGTDNPNDKLEVSGDIKTTGALKLFNSTNHYGTVDADSEGLTVDTVANRHLRFLQNGNEAMRIDTSSNVGIGTSLPTKKLEVLGGLVINSGFNTGIASLYLSHTSTQSQHKAGIFTTYTTGYGRSSSMQFALNSEMNSNIVTTADAKMTIVEDGKVGIGTVAPSAMLEVSGSHSTTGRTAKFTTTKATKSNNTYTLEVDSTAHTSNMTSAGAMSVDVNSGRAFTIAGNGKVGIGTTSPGEKLQVNGKILANNGSNLYIDSTATQTVFANTTSIPMRFQTNSIVRLTLGGNGDASFTGNVNINSVFDFNTSTDLFTISNNQNTGGINLSGGNSRIYFGGNRALEGAQDGSNLFIGEGYSEIHLQDTTNITGDLTVTGTVTAQEFHTEFVSASILYESGSTKFGDTSDDIHSFTGSLNVEGNMKLSTGGYLYGDTTTTYLRLNTAVGSLLGYSNAYIGLGPSFVYNVGGSEKFRIQSSTGNVGIGTNSPLDLLHVRATGSDARVIIDGDTGYDAELKFFEAGTAKYTAGFDAATGDFVIGTVNVDTTKRFTINSSGRIGLPSYGSGTHTGTVASTLGVDSSGNIIEFTGGGGGSVSAITSGADTRVAYFNGTDSLEGSANFTWDDTQLTVVGDVEAEEFIGDLRGASLFKAKAGEDLAKGDAVYISGISGNTTVVSKADADDVNKMPAFGIASTAASLNNPADIYTFGTLKGIDTSGFTIGDELYVSSSAGELTATAPTGESSLIQKIAKVTRVDASAGSIKISGAGRTNATPNLNEGRLFVGNASNQAVADGTIHVDIANSRVGIGTTNPTKTLDVAGDVYINSNYPSNAAANDLTIGKTTTGDHGITVVTANTNTGAIFFADNDNNDAGSIKYQHGPNAMRFTTNRTEQMRIDSNGNVGIGTTSPGSKLHVEGNIQLGSGAATDDNSLIVYGNNGTASRYIKLIHHNASSSSIQTNNTYLSISAANYIVLGNNTLIYEGVKFSNDKKLEYQESDNSYFTVLNVNSSNLIQIGSVTSTSTGGDTAFYHTGVEKMRIISTGHVGIGTSTPSRKLTVGNTTALTGNIIALASTGSSGAYSQLAFGDEADDNEAQIIYTPSSGKLQLQTGGGGVITNRGLTLDSSENVGIGTASPGAKLDVHGRVDFANDLRLRGTDSSADQGVVRFYVNSNNNLTIDTSNNGNNLFVIDEGGQVGINTSSPSRTLDVNGEIQNNGIFRKGGNVIIKSTGSETMFGPGGSGIITFHNSATMTTGDETMRIDANGNLLLNNTSANARLDIREDTNYAIRAEDASGHYFRVNTGGDVDMRGDLVVQGTITAQQFHSEFVSASIIYDSGSTKFGDTSDDNHDFTGSLNLLGSAEITGDIQLVNKSDALIFGSAGSNGTWGAPKIGRIDSNLIISDYSGVQLGGYSGSAYGPRMTVKGTGNVGIGTTSPDSPLEVQFVEANGTSKEMLHLDYNPTDNYGSAIFKISSGTSANNVFEIEQVTGGGAGDFGTYLDTNIINRNASSGAYGNINFVTGASTSASSIVMTIGGGTQKGNVGIGTSNPGHKLDVLGTIRGTGTTSRLILDNTQGQSFQIYAWSTGTNIYNNSSTNPNVYFGRDAGTANNFYFTRNGTDFTMKVDTANERVGIGTTSMGYTLDVESDDNILANFESTTNKGAIRISDDDTVGYISAENGRIGFGTSPILSTANITMLTSNNNVGVGNTSPTYKLSVAGGISAGGKVTYTKSAGSLDTTGYAVAGLTAASNGASAGFTFTCYGHGGYQKVVYSCYNVSGTWNTVKAIDEGTNALDIEASANGSTITFTFKTRSGTKYYTPRVTVEATGTSINNTYA